MATQICGKCVPPHRSQSAIWSNIQYEQCYRRWNRKRAGHSCKLTLLLVIGIILLVLWVVRIGKTHLAISLAIAAAKYGRRVYFSTLADLVTSLEEAHAVGALRHRLLVLSHPSLLVVDEIGYIPIRQTGAMLFFQLMSRRYERSSTVLTSNKSFDEWGDILGDEVMAAALIDRVLHHCHIVNIRGNSYRMRHHTEVWKAMHPDGSSDFDEEGELN